MVQTRTKARAALEPPKAEHKPDPKPKKVIIKVPKAKPAPESKPAPEPEPKPAPEAEPAKAIAQAIIDLSKPTYDADYLHYLDVLRRNREWKAKHKTDTAEYMKMRMADLGIRGRYNKARREAYAKARAKGPARIRGRPRIPITYVADAENAIKAALGANTVNVGNLLRATLLANPKMVIKVPDSVPDKFKKILGKEVVIPNNPDTWYFTKVGNWWIPHSHTTDGGIQDSTKVRYLASARKLLKMDYTLPNRVLNPPEAEKTDPNVISRWCLEPAGPDNPTPFDFWKTVDRLYSESLIHASRFNGNTTPLATIWSATLRYWYSSSQLNFKAQDFDKLGWMHIVWASKTGLGSYAKNETFINRAKQEPSERVKENIMDYDIYRAHAAEFIAQYFTLSGDTYKIKTKTTLAEAQEVAAVACYLFIPPVRNSWCLMELADKPQDKDERRNVLVMSEEGATAYWSDFKNVKAFKNKGILPLEQPLPQKLVSVLRAYIKLLKENGQTKWLFPHANKFHMSSNEFGELLANTTEKISEMLADGSGMKRIGSSILRIMFITWYHSQGDSVFDQEAIMKVMIQLHQTDLATHISYIKKIVAEQGAEVALDERYTNLLGLITAEANEALNGVDVERDDKDKVVVPEVEAVMTKKVRVPKPKKQP
jgi:hypothetical protein